MWQEIIRTVEGLFPICPRSRPWTCRMGIPRTTFYRRWMLYDRYAASSRGCLANWGFDALADRFTLPKVCLEPYSAGQAR